MLLRASSFAVLWLLCASIAEAAPAPRSGAGLCDGQPATARKLLRHYKSFGGPLKRPSTRSLFGLSDPLARMRRASFAHFGSDDDAIQNDAPAAQIGLDERPTPALRPIGLLPRAHDPRPPTRAFTPRAPRGPPTIA